MKKLLLSMLISLSLFGGSLKNELFNLSFKQRDIMITSIKSGKQYDLGYTLAAIAWQESKFGEYLVNLNDPSCGVYHIYLPDLLNRLGKKDTSWNRNVVCSRLINDFNFGLTEAIGRLEFWKNYWYSKGLRGNKLWRYMIMSYNAGTSFLHNKKSKMKAKQYLKHIIRKVRVLKRYVLID